METAFRPEEIDQLKRAAQMFELILDAGAQTDEAYEALKELYGKLQMHDEFKRVTARFAAHLLAREERARGVAELAELAERYPDEAQWRERLAELGAPLQRVGADAAPAEPPVATDGGPEAGGAAGAVSREAVRAFNQLKGAVELRALEVLRGAGPDGIRRAVRDAQRILCGLERAPAAAGLEEEPVVELVPVEPVHPLRRRRVPGKAAAKMRGARGAADRAAPKGRRKEGAELEKEAQRSLRVGEMLVERGVITRDNLDEALARQRESGQRLGEVLVELGYAMEEDVLNCLALQAGVPYLPLRLYDVQPQVAALLPEAVVRRHCVLPVDVIANSVLVTIATPLAAETKREIEALLGERRVSYYISAEREIEEKLDELYPSSGGGEV
jgi:hypothetical protein